MDIGKVYNSRENVYTRSVSFFNLVLYIASFFIIWLGAGLIVSSVDRFSKKLRLSSFAFSFFVLGILTSIPEFAVGMTAIAENQPEIFVGNLIGGIPVIFFLIIPILAIFGNGIKLRNQLNTKDLLFSFVVMITPALLVMDRRVTNLEGFIMIGLYVALFFFIQREKGIFDTQHSNILRGRAYSYVDIVKTLLGIGLVFVASQIIVDNTLYFAKIFHISPFFISLVILSLGTNLPELSLAVRSIISRKKDIAFGDYIGSAAANTFLFGLFTILNTGEVVTVNNFFKTFLVMAGGLSLFYYFIRSKDDILRKEGLVLLLVYLAFIFIDQIIF